MNRYIEKWKETIEALFSEKREGQSSKEEAKSKVMRSLKYGVYLITAFALVRGVLVTARANITVSNTVNGRELPIYCVETKEPEIALTFDAAWGNEDTAKILEILEKNDVRVTFFMTGGWVDK